MICAASTFSVAPDVELLESREVPSVSLRSLTSQLVLRLDCVAITGFSPEKSRSGE
jgi:hypothetical protein